jgi:hypothetical protein|tara:strand:- start:3652 stop:3861 length:210 start_codon:yes stop_codon:yes gene_type:complete
MFRIGDLVTHVDYPDQIGRVVAKYTKTFNGVILVLWIESLKNPGAIVLRDGSRTSRHIPGALRRVQNPR